MTPLLAAQIVLTLFVFVALLSSAAGMVYFERKVAALLQQRLGPYLVGPKGLLQPLADVIKLMFKENWAARGIHPFSLAPIISATGGICRVRRRAFGASRRCLTCWTRHCRTGGGRM
jgi:NADH-quinone oxidoreductase subunit H